MTDSSVTPAPLSHKIPLSVYVHFPWCVRKCPYCDFNSHALTATADMARYQQALYTDLAQEAELVKGRTIQSVFFGGGTPSLAPAQLIENTLDGLRKYFGLADAAEVTLEANPGTFDEARFRAYRAAGVNRLSIGVQSFADEALKRLGRIHDGFAAKRAVDLALREFSRVNVDLMHGVPQQTAADALADLSVAIDLGARHLSWYQLTIEPNTEFFTQPPQLPNEEVLEEIEAEGFRLLSNAGLERYEVSAWAYSNHHCQHNLNYWQFGDYLGIGAGAHGKLTLSDQRILRYNKSRGPNDYMKEQGRRQIRFLDKEEIPLEFLMNALRLREGVAEKVFVDRTGLALAPVQAKLQQLRQRGLLQPDRLATTELGYRFLDSVLAEFSADVIRS